MADVTLVIGATGTVGSQVVGALARRGGRIRAATRAPERARRALPAGVEIVEFDYERPETFAPGLDGVDRLFLSVRPGDAQADRTAIPFVDRALAAGVGRIVTLTAMGVERIGENALRRIEMRVEASRAAWTHLRPNFFMQIFTVPPLVSQVRRAGVLRIPAGEARLSFVDVRDIAEVAARALLEEGHAGRAYTLTGGESLSHARGAALIARASGRRVSYASVDEDEARRGMAASGLPAERVERLLSFYRLVRAGACEPVSPDITAATGRPPTRFEAFAADYSETWRSEE